MNSKLLEVLISIVLGFFSGILLSGGRIHIEESGIHIYLAASFG
ncbi:hypothetical protein [Paenibacillus allorhizoplanae]|nr:hypothetical protein [Paenibacillus allorhizoplanae]